MLMPIGSDAIADPKRAAIIVREWERSFELSMHDIYGCMRRLSSVSKQIEGRRFYIECYDKRSQGYGMTLRWRGVDLQGHKHALWETVEGDLNTMPGVVLDWYVRSNDEMSWLNTIEKIVRGMLKKSLSIREYGLHINK